MRSPGEMTTRSPEVTPANVVSMIPSLHRTRTESGRKAMRSVSASRPRSMDKSSRISATRTNVVIMSAVTHSPMAAAAAMASSIDSSILISA